jgi:hypothetical protein
MLQAVPLQLNHPSSDGAGHVAPMSSVRSDAADDGLDDDDGPPQMRATSVLGGHGISMGGGALASPRGGASEVLGIAVSDLLSGVRGRSDGRAVVAPIGFPSEGGIALRQPERVLENGKRSRVAPLQHIPAEGLEVKRHEAGKEWVVGAPTAGYNAWTNMGVGLGQGRHGVGIHLGAPMPTEFMRGAAQVHDDVPGPTMSMEGGVLDSVQAQHLSRELLDSLAQQHQAVVCSLPLAAE